MGSAGAEKTSQASAEETLKTNEPPQEQTEEWPTPEDHDCKKPLASELHVKKTESLSGPLLCLTEAVRLEKIGVWMRGLHLDFIPDLIVVYPPPNPFPHVPIHAQATGV